MKLKFHFLLLLACAACAVALRAEGLNAEAQARLDQVRADAIKWAADPVIVGAVVAQNQAIAPELAELNQEKWEALPDKSPILQRFIRHPASEFLRTQAGTRISEAFISDANGRKVAFLAKTSSWSHQAKPKHDVPMSGKPWQGKLEVDRSAGTAQVQIAVPVLENNVPVGSLVLGVPVTVLSGQ